MATPATTACAARTAMTSSDGGDGNDTLIGDNGNGHPARRRRDDS